MDAKVDDWVVTPRRGKAVEINALWFNALRLMEEWADEMDDAAGAEYQARAERVYESFNERFWYDERRLSATTSSTASRGGDDREMPAESDLRDRLAARGAGTRTMGAGHADRARAAVTPVGLRSLAPDDPDYKARYFGDLRARDAAYHQGTVWAWLVGPFVDAWLKVYPTTRPGRGRPSRGSSSISTKRASDRSAKCSTPSRRSRRAAASRRRGAWLRCCASGSSSERGRTVVPRRPRRPSRKWHPPCDHEPRRRKHGSGRYQEGGQYSRRHHAGSKPRQRRRRGIWRGSGNA